MPFMQQDPRRLVWQQNDRYLWIEPWGENSLRVRSGRHLPVMRNEDWALLSQSQKVSATLIMSTTRQR